MFSYFNRARDTHCPDSNSKFVLLLLADRANGNGECFPGVTYLCERSQLSKSSVLRALQSLKQAGLIDYTPSRGRRRTNRYHLFPEKVSQGNLFDVNGSGNGTSTEKVSHRNVSHRHGKGVTQTPHPSVIPRSTHKEGQVMRDPEKYQRMKQALHELYDREPEHTWSYVEESTLSDVTVRPNAEKELAQLAAAKRAGAFMPRSIEKLLTNWGKVLDEIRQPNPSADHGKPRQESLLEKQARADLARIQKQYGP